MCLISGRPDARQDTVSNRLSETCMEHGLRSPLADRTGLMNSPPVTRPKPLVFNFESLNATPPSKASPTASAAKLGRRKGHHHKHSLSHQFFLPPVQRAPLSLPASFPIPTVRDLVRSSTTDQRMQMIWALFHLGISLVVMKYNSASLAASSLSKCIAFDALGIASAAIFEIMNHFPVWQNSSIKHPFGLKRAEVVAQFGAAVYLTYSGVELIREVVERLIIGGGHGHGPTDAIHLDPHSLSSDLMSVSMFTTLGITLFAAVVFDNHGRLCQALDLEDLPRLLRNPFYLLTLVPACILLLFSTTGMHLHGFVDRLIAFAIAASLMCIGMILIHRLGSILLMTYPSSSIESLFQEIENDDCVASVDGKVWQVWTGLVVVCLKTTVRGGEASEVRVRERITRYTRDILGGGYGSGKAIRFDVRVECERI